MAIYTDKKYSDDSVFQLINRRYITLNEDEIRASNEHLKKVIEASIIPLMREDALFKILFQRLIYGGSFYKGTKFGKPDEFDLVFVMQLPLNYSKIRIDTNHDNYTYVKIKIDTEGQMYPDWEKHKQVFSEWLTSDNYLDHDKFHSWMEGVVSKAIRRLGSGGANYIASFEQRTSAFKETKHTPTYRADLHSSRPTFMNEMDNTPLYAVRKLKI